MFSVITLYELNVLVAAAIVYVLKWLNLVQKINAAHAQSFQSNTLDMQVHWPYSLQFSSTQQYIYNFSSLVLATK